MKIDRYTLFKMKRQGFCNAEVARRLNCSTKQVGRIVREIEQDKNIDFVNDPHLRNKDIEKTRIKFYLHFESESNVAQRFGLSRQTINQLTTAEA